MSLEDYSLETRDELALLARELSENPATRKQFLKLTKQARPDMPIPELEIEEYTRAAVDRSEDRVSQLESQLRERDAILELGNRRDRLMKKGLIDREEDVEGVEKVMLEKGITNHETAAEYWRWMKESAAPTPSGYNPKVISKFDLSKYWKNPVMGARDEAAKALNELRKNPRPIGL